MLSPRREAPPDRAERRRLRRQWPEHRFRFSGVWLDEHAFRWLLRTVGEQRLRGRQVA